MCSVEKYNPTTNAWMQVPDMSQPRKEFGIAVIDDTIFALGGIQGYTLRNSVECYDEKSNKWTAARDMNTYVLDMSACVIMDLPNVCDYVGLPNAFDYIKY
jgi:hypothetical protein